MKLFPHLAAVYCHTIVNQYVVDLFLDMQGLVAKGDFSMNALMHHFSSGLKAVQTQDTLDGMFVVRQSLGGAGYSAWSGIPRMIDEWSPTVTFEGDNTVMLQ
jgi:acyl-CoA oxidase